MKVGILAVAGIALAASSAMAQVELIGSSPYTPAYMDISTTGMALNAVSGAPVDVTTTIGNRVFPVGTVRVWAAGGMAWNPGPDTGLPVAPNVAIPPTGAPHADFGPGQYWLPFWDILDFRPAPGVPDPGNRDIYFQEIGDRAIFQWNNVGILDGGSVSENRATFQVQIVRGAAGVNYFLQTIYDPEAAPGEGIEGLPFDHGNSATIGYLDGDSDQNFGNNEQWGFNGDPTDVDNGTVITVIPAPGTAALLGLGALLAGRRRRA